MDYKSRKQLNEFPILVRKNFDFLESDYSYLYQGVSELDFQYPKDARVEVSYVGKVGVKIIWAVGEANVGICLCKLVHGEFPEKSTYYYNLEGYEPAISIDTLVKMVTNEKCILPIPEITQHMSIAEMGRRADKRSKMLHDDMDGVLEKYATLLKGYAADILRGDMSAFTEVQKYHSNLYGR